MRNLLSIFAVLFSVTSFACNSLIDEKLRILDSTESESLCKYEGDVLLIVNVASKCGYTPQYEGLQKLYSEYGDKGFTVIGIPSRDYMWQEFTDESKTAEFCDANYNVTFPLYATTRVRGDQAHPLFKILSRESGKEPSWNFNKFLISKEGKLVGMYDSKVLPESLAGKIENLL